MNGELFLRHAVGQSIFVHRVSVDDIKIRNRRKRRWKRQPRNLSRLQRATRDLSSPLGSRHHLPPWISRKRLPHLHLLSGTFGALQHPQYVHLKPGSWRSTSPLLLRPFYGNNLHLEIVALWKLICKASEFAKVLLIFFIKSLPMYIDWKNDLLLYNLSFDFLFARFIFRVYAYDFPDIFGYCCRIMVRGRDILGLMGGA